MSAYEVYQTVLTGICTSVLMLIALAVGIAVAAVYIAPVIRWMKRHKVDAALIAPFVVGIILYGGSKGTVSYPYTDVEQRYLYDAGSYVTNGYVHVAFTALLLPQTAMIYAYSRPYGSTNDLEWTERMAEPLSELATQSNVYGRDVYFEGAEDSEVQVFTDYRTGPTVHTNGVAVVMWQKPFDGSTNRAAMVRTGIWIEGMRFAPDAGLTNGLPQRTLGTIMIQEDN